MPHALTCSQCKAPVTDDRWINCPYCGALLVKPVLNPNKAVVAPERFAAVENSPEYASLARHRPATLSHSIGGGMTVLVLALVTVAVAFLTVVVAKESGFVAVFPAIVTVLALVMLQRAMKSAQQFSAAPLERHIVVWRDERIEVSGGGDNRRAVTHHYALLENREGERIEFRCGAQLAGAHAPGDIGVAFLRGGILLDFKRVAV